MLVTKAHFHAWRNIADCEVPLCPGINVLWGRNAQGKSNMLEGIYFFARGRSFRGAKERELIRFDADYASAALDFRRDGYENDTRLEVFLPSAARFGKKKLLRNGAPLSSAAEMMGSFRAVLFCPANLSLVTGGPAERRTFLDVAVSQLSGAYLTHLRRYTRLLAERNALLKRAADGNPVSAEEWAVYAEGLSEAGAWIAAYRLDYITQLETGVSRHFADMTGGREVPALRYTSHALAESSPTPRPLTDPMSSAAAPDPAPLYEKLSRNLDREIAAGSTLWGIHKDDLLLSLNGTEARLFASQGQQRSIVLALKLSEAEIAEEIGGEYPVILLDDVFSELDEGRRAYLLDTLGRGFLDSGNSDPVRRQIIVTSCEPDVIPGDAAGHVHFCHVENGGITGR